MATTTPTATRARALRLGRYVPVEGSRVPTFRKDVLPVGRAITLPDGREINLSLDEARALCAATNAWILAGHDVPFPAGHSTDPRDNLGVWLARFEVADHVDPDTGAVEPRIFGAVEARDPEAARGIVNGTVTDVSVCLEHDVLAETGQTIPLLLTHVCATPVPVVGGQGPFARLSRRPETAPMAEAAAPPPAPAEAAAPSLANLAKLLGLGEDADLAAVEAAVKALVAEDEEAPMPAPMASRLARAVDSATAPLKAQLARLEAEAKGAREAVVDAEIKAVKVELARAGRPELLDADAEKDVRALYPTNPDLAKRLLGRALALAAPSGDVRANPASGDSTEAKKKADLARAAAVAESLGAREKKPSSAS